MWGTAQGSSVRCKWLGATTCVVALRLAANQRQGQCRADLATAPYSRPCAAGDRAPATRTGAMPTQGRCHNGHNAPVFAFVQTHLERQRRHHDHDQHSRLLHKQTAGTVTVPNASHSYQAQPSPVPPRLSTASLLLSVNPTCATNSSSPRLPKLRASASSWISSCRTIP